MSYNEKRNEANGEGNRDGESHNRSWNSGAEGPTTDPEVLALRARQQRNFITTLMLSQGVPMLLHGDEVAHSKQGNNNTYAQDSELSWIDWGNIDQAGAQQLDFTARVIQLRKSHPIFRRRRFFKGAPSHGGESELREIEWFRPDGTHMAEADWATSFARSLMIFLNGNAITEPGARGETITDDSMLLLVNGDGDSVQFKLPDKGYALEWEPVLSTADPLPSARVLKPAATVKLEARSVLVLAARPAETASKLVSSVVSANSP